MVAFSCSCHLPRLSSAPAAVAVGKLMNRLEQAGKSVPHYPSTTTAATVSCSNTTDKNQIISDGEHTSR